MGIACALNTYHDTHRAEATITSTQLSAHRLQSSMPAAAGPKPLVVLIGWLGANPKHLRKYEQLWQGMGYDTVSKIPSIPEVALPVLGEWAAYRFMREVSRVHFEQPSRPVTCHVFRQEKVVLLSGVC